MLVKAKKDGREVECEVTFGDDLKGSIAAFGEDAVFGVFQAQAKIKAQAVMRGHIESGKTDEEVVAAMASWDITQVAERVAADPQTRALNAYKRLPEEEKAEYMEKLRDIAAG